MEGFRQVLSRAPWAIEPLSALIFTALVAVAFAPLELAFPARRSARDRRSVTTDLLFATIGTAVTRALLFVVLGSSLATVRAASAAVGLGPASPLNDWPGIVRVAVGLLVFELGGYAYHRFAHRAPLLWRLHAVHHGAPAMDWLAAFRQHPIEIVLMTVAQNVPIVLLGVPLGEHAGVVSFLALNTVFVHANLRVPRALELVLATPRFHHRHHDADRPPANYATLFPWLDRLFGTYDGAAAERVGLDGAAAGFLDLLLLRRRGASRA
ncbi:MAG TPA: sterol desaturase family protein [Sandaracinaceae bacterium]